jgi:uncharacterized membrane protein
MMTEKPNVKNTISRYPFLDFIRGFAVINMIVFHVIYDMTFTGILPSRIALDPYFLGYGKYILFSFLFCAGLSLTLVHNKGLRWKKFWQREIKLIAAAAAVSAGTYFAFPTQFVFFGILHCMALCSLVALPLIILPKYPSIIINTTISAALLIPYYGWGYNLPWINITNVVSMDYVSPFPWAALFTLGIAAYHLKIHEWTTHFHWFPRIKWLGNHSLSIYLIHQPLIIGMLYAYLYLSR